MIIMREFLFAIGFTTLGYLLCGLMTAAKNELMSDDDEDVEEEKEESTEEKETSVDVDEKVDVIPDEDINNITSLQ